MSINNQKKNALKSLTEKVILIKKEEYGFQ
jgi:hypothetical protein